MVQSSVGKSIGYPGLASIGLKRKELGRPSPRPGAPSVGKSPYPRDSPVTDRASPLVAGSLLGGGLYGEEIDVEGQGGIGRNLAPRALFPVSQF